MTIVKSTAVSLALILPLLFVFFLMTGEAAHAHHKSSACKTYDVPETDAGWIKSRKLIKRGWYGQPSDGAERLYSPRCRR